jgi:hypothetical protein
MLGSFLWVRCQLESLRSCLNQASLEEALTLPPKKSLTEMYLHVLRRIEPKIRDNIYQVLAWVSLSERSLTLQEIMFIFSLHWDAPGVLLPNKELMSLALLDPQILVAPLSGLLSTYPIAHPYAEGELSRTGVRLAHATVKEFLEAEGHRYQFKNYSLVESDSRRFITDASRALIKNWIASCTEGGSDLTGNSKDVGRLATVFDLTWPR